MRVFEGVKSRLLMTAVLTAAPLAACARTELDEPLWNDATAGAPSLGGAVARVSTAGRAASGAPSQGGAAGHLSAVGGAGTTGKAGFSGAGGSRAGGAGMSGMAGSAGEGEAGTDTSPQTLDNCSSLFRAVLDGPFASETARTPDSAVWDDWNFDGKLDLATGNDDGSVSLLFGRGNGSFSSSVVYTSGLEGFVVNQPGRTAIASGDLDGKGRPDLVVANAGTPWVSVLLHASDATFATVGLSGVEGNPMGIVLGDFDSDGDLDVIAAGDTGAVSLLRNNGKGALGSKQVMTITSDAFRSIATADLNHDGHLDLVVLSHSKLFVLSGDGAGGFVPGQTVTTTEYHSSVTIADFNADGAPDLALIYGCEPFFGSSSQLDILLGHGDGTFAAAVSNPSSGHCLERIAVADVNGDGAADLVTSPSTLLPGNGDGSFQPETASFRLAGGDLLGLADWNGDGILDVAASTESWVAVDLGHGDGTFGSTELHETALQPHSLVLADLNQDSVTDAVTADYFAYRGTTFDSSVSVLLGVGFGNFDTHVDYSTTDGTTIVAAVDLNRDGVLDLVTTGQNSMIGVLLGTGGGQFAAQQTWQQGKTLTLAVGDLNGDHIPDLVAGTLMPGTITPLLGKGDGTFSAKPASPIATSLGSLALLDANGDAQLDLAVTFPDTGTASVLLGRGDGSFSAGEEFATSADHAQITGVDLNADGKLDLVSWGPNSFAVMLGAGNGSFVKRGEYLGSPGKIVSVDFDRDTAQDLVMTDSTGFTIALGSRDGGFSCVERYAPGIAMGGIAVADLNRDGRMDVATTTDFGLSVFLNSTQQ